MYKKTEYDMAIYILNELNLKTKNAEFIAELTEHGTPYIIAPRGEIFYIEPAEKNKIEITAPNNKTKKYYITDSGVVKAGIDILNYLLK